MNVIVISHPDPASTNIRDRLLELVEWVELTPLNGQPVRARNGQVMIEIADQHLYHDMLGQQAEEHLEEYMKEHNEEKIDCLIYASRHRSKSGQPTLTVHPLGIYAPTADFGGKPRTLIPTAPGLMSQALRLLQANVGDLDFQVLFEVSHHGPHLSTPALFIEIGSDESQWPRKDAAEVIAKTILSMAPISMASHDYPVAIGVGGGHYAPRFSDLVRDFKISFGHMVPSYALEHLDADMVDKLIEATPKASMVYFHRKIMKKPKLRELEELFEQKGLRSVRSSDLSRLSG